MSDDPKILKATRRIYVPAFHLDNVVADVDDMTLEQLQGYLGGRGRGGAERFIVVTDDWLERYAVIRAAVEGLGRELEAMPEYGVVPVSRLKVGEETVRDVEHHLKRV